MQLYSESVQEEALHAIVADVGGTNARFSHVNLSTFVVDKTVTYPCKHFSSLMEALRYYQREYGLFSVKHMALAIACPIIDDKVMMTNFHWQFSIQKFKEQLELSHFQVLNDFSAAALSLPLLKTHEKFQIGHGVVLSDKPMVALGAGTGLGVAFLISTSQGFMPVPGEGGHASWSAQSEDEWFIQRFLTKKYGHVSWERLLSGPGLENLYLAFACQQKMAVKPLSAANITRLAVSTASSGLSLIAKAAVSQFFASLGSFAGDLALATGAFGGIYLAGGIIPKLLPLLQKSSFRERFESKGRSSYINKSIPTFVVLADYPGLIGAALFLKQTINLRRPYS